MRGVWLGVAALVVIAPFASAPRSSAASRVDDLAITFIECSKNIGKQTHTRVITGSPFITDSSPEVDLPPSKAQAATVLHRELPAGMYNIMLIDGEGGCGDTLQVRMLPNRNRRVVAIARGFMLDQPRPGTCNKTFEVPAIVEGDAYYASALPHGHASEVFSLNETTRRA
jgi:hypothetical protein